MVCTLFALVIPVSANWSVILKNLPFYDYFFGPTGTVTDLQTVTGLESQSPLGSALSSEQLQHTILVVGWAILGAVLVFVAIKAITALVASATMTLKELTAAETPAKHQVEREIGRRVTIRAVVIGVWALYILLFIKAILPFAILASQIGLSQGRPISTGAYYLMFAGLLLFSSLHVHVIMLRLLLLRPRVFGGRDVIVGS